MAASYEGKSRKSQCQKKNPAVAAGLFVLAGLLVRQSGKPAASGGFVALDAESLAVELVLLVLGLVLLPPLVLGISLRTCLVTLFQHFIAPGDAS